MKLQAKTRLQSGWWDAMSDTAKKAYKKLHPNSKVGQNSAKPAADSKGSPEEIAKARDAHKAAKDAYTKVRDSGGANRSDAEWAKHDAALERLQNATKRLKKLGASFSKRGHAARIIASTIPEVVERMRKHAEKMDQTSRTSPEYLRMQFEMQRMLKELRALDPTGANTPFDYLTWSHTGKPPRQNRNRLYSGLDKDGSTDDFDGNPEELVDPLSTGVGFDTLVDGEPDASEPAVQNLTKNDGTIETPPEQELLMDDLVPSELEFG